MSERFSLVLFSFCFHYLSTLLWLPHTKKTGLHSLIGCPIDRSRPHTSLPIWRPNCPLRDAVAQPTYWQFCGTSRRRRRDCAVCREVRRVAPGNVDTARGCQRLRSLAKQCCVSNEHKMALGIHAPNFSMGQVVHIGSEQTQCHPFALCASARRASILSMIEFIF